jgi:hypothetical protein
MEKYHICLCIWGEKGEEIMSTNDIRHATEEARDLQRILSQEKKDEGYYYGVFERGFSAPIYKPIGY